ncbi:Coq4 family protein [Mastigocoleus sp. MO_188.B34]|uniref:Coq4 family protein n=1 Tax=Mastigocoleus sp. MO_188.B34 TaxID=3036635 RepID=UPI00260825EF|nr:Coq4 family protein [Mastigocoleus sp. MO_188.B34]MDJ0697603.1 Coq4 family protein [Mastigocoleus sp. MO_188.B34]
MSFKYINEIATPENINELLTFIDLAAGANQETTNVFDISDKLRDSTQMQECIVWMKQDPATAAAIAERYMGADFDLQELIKMPQGSLGWTYARVMNALGYDPHFYRLRETTSDTDYIINRIRKTHDLHHILTGFSFDDFGENGVISVTVVQTGYPGWMLIDILTLLLYFFSGKDDLGIDVEFVFDLISAGIKMGRRAKPLFPVKWEEGFERPLEEWRKELNIQPITNGRFSWYSNPKLREAVGLEVTVPD